MTRRDYEFLAACFRSTLASESLWPAARAGIRVAAADMAYALAQANPRFDQALFLRNAGCERPVPATSYGGTTSE